MEEGSGKIVVVDQQSSIIKEHVEKMVKTFRAVEEQTKEVGFTQQQVFETAFKIYWG